MFMKTIAVVLFLIALLVYFSGSMKRQYKREVKSALERTSVIDPGILTAADLEHLPVAVRHYLEYTGVVGKPKVVSFRMQARGGIRSNPEDDWMWFTSDQYNFYDQTSRFFWIAAKKKGIQASGLHAYKNGQASMVIRLLGLIRLVDARGPEMDQAETVTVFNDMCVMAPATLADAAIQWEERDSLTVDALFTHCGITIGATLFFNEDGQLVNFLSLDRYETADGKTYKNYPWETPITEYRQMGDYRLPAKADLIFKRPAGDFCYGQFELDTVIYNP